MYENSKIQEIKNSIESWQNHLNETEDISNLENSTAGSEEEKERSLKNNKEPGNSSATAARLWNRKNIDRCQ